MINSTALWIFIPTACNAQTTISALLNILGTIFSIRCTYAGFWCFCYLYLIKNNLSPFKTVHIFFQGWGFFSLWLIESCIAQYRFSFCTAPYNLLQGGISQEKNIQNEKKEKREKKNNNAWFIYWHTRLWDFCVSFAYQKLIVIKSIIEISMLPTRPNSVISSQLHLNEIQAWHRFQPKYSLWGQDALSSEGELTVLEGNTSLPDLLNPHTSLIL